MTNFRPVANNPFPLVIKNLIIINVLFWLGTIVCAYSYNYDLAGKLGLYSIKSPHFEPYQIITHMFMHSLSVTFLGIPFIGHILLNMWGLWMFGTPLENIWGPKRFLNFYLICGLGAAFVNLIANYVAGTGIDAPTVGASGAVFGVLAGFAVLFPNSEMIIIPIPVPIKAKYLVGAYFAYEIFSGVSNRLGDNVAHFAHIGGAIFGFVIVKIWQHNRKDFY